MKICPKCGRTYDESLSFCLEDGTTLALNAAVDEEATISFAAPRRRERNSNSWVFVSLALGLLILLLAGMLGAVYVVNNLDAFAVGGNSNANGSRRVATNSSPSPRPSANKPENINTNVNANLAANQNAANLPENANVNKPATDPDKIPKLTQGMSYAVARNQMKSYGWQGILGRPGPEIVQREYVIDKLGYTEVESCAGSGPGFCRFVFTNVNKKKLVIVTFNNDPESGPPKVQSWMFEDQ